LANTAIITFPGGWVVGGIETKASPSILLWLRALQNKAKNYGHYVDACNQGQRTHSTWTNVSFHQQKF
jgi:hypothetical protein